MKTTTPYMKAIAAGIILFAGISSVFAQTDNNKKVLPEFNSIVVDSPIDIKLSQGTETSITANAGNEMDEVKAEVKDNVLYLKGRGGDDITINFTKLNKIELQANCDVKSINQINSDKLEVFLTGAASDINLDVNVKELFSTISGAGDIKYKGTADSHTIQIKGAGDMEAYQLETNNTTVEISGAGDAQVNVKQDLTGTINGAGDINYLNEPVTKNIKVNGFGSYGLKGSEKNSHSENTEMKHDTIKFNLGDYNVYMMKSAVGVNGKEKPIRDTAKGHHDFKIYWAGLGLGINGYLNANNQTKVPAGYNFLDLDYNKSINVSLNFWEQKIPLWKRHINIVTGMGFDISNYRFTTNNSKLMTDTSFIAATYDTALTYKKNKLVTTYLNVPLLLQFDTNPFGKHNKTVHFSAGVVGGMRIGSHTKQVYSINDVKDHSKTHDNFDLSPFRYSAMARIGIGKLDLYASYALNGLFKKNEGPQLYPFTVGITLVGF